MPLDRSTGSRSFRCARIGFATSTLLVGILCAASAASHAEIFEATLVRITTGSPQGMTDAVELTGVNFEFDADAGSITQLSAQTHAIFDLNPLPANNLFEHKFSGAFFDTGAKTVSASAYECIEGQFGPLVGASLCANVSWGPNFINESAVDYSTIPGTRVVGGDDVVAGPQQQIFDYASEPASWDGTTLIIQTPSWTANPGGAGLQLEFMTTGGSGPELLDVPAVTGLQQAAAEAAIVGAGLVVGDVSRALDNTIPAGIVIQQQPTACIECALAESAVDLLISLGPPMPGRAPALIGDLIDDVMALNLNKGLSNALVGKLENAHGKLVDGNENSDRAAFNTLRAFVNQVDAQAGKKISAADARYLVARVDAIFEVARETCNGLAPTIVGTEGDDDIDGTDGIDVISGLGGSDRISGFAGDDVVCGGDGNDDLIGGDGADHLFGGADNDVLEGNAGNDFCNGDSGIDSASLDCEIRDNMDTDVMPVTLFADDGVQLDGALYVPTNDALRPGGRYRKLAMIVSHGAMGSYEFSVPKIMGLHASPLGFTVLALNRRDAGPEGGGGAVLFEDATTDLGVGIRLLNAMGYDTVFVAGHSQGTNNAAIFPSFTMDPTVAGVGLYGTVDDGRDTAKNLLFNPDVVTPGYDENVVTAEQLVAMGQGDIVIAWLTAFDQFLFRSPANFLSYWGPGSLSVVEREIQKLDVPAFLMRADGDEFTPDAMSQNVLDSALAAGVDATYVVLDYPFDPGFFGGNAHGFVGVEREMIATTVDWLIDRIPEASQYTQRIEVPVP